MAAPPAIAFSLIAIPRQLRLGEIDSVAQMVQVLEPSLSIAFFLSAFVVYLLSLETRSKRDRTLLALHELRAIAHVVDMHQLTKVENLTSGLSRKIWQKLTIVQAERGPVPHAREMPRVSAEGA